MASHHKTKRATWFVIAFVVIVAAVLLIVRFAPSKDYSYNNFPIEKGTCAGTKVTCWYALVHLRDTDYTISFYHHPTELEAIGVSPAAILAVYNFQNAGGIITIGVPKNAPAPVTLGATEVSRILGTRYQIFNFNVKAALLGDAEGEVSCADANKQSMVIRFVQQDITAVTLTAPNCITLGATSINEATKVADVFAYKLLGVMPLVNETESDTIVPPVTPAANNS